MEEVKLEEVVVEDLQTTVNEDPIEELVEDGEVENADKNNLSE